MAKQGLLYWRFSGFVFLTIVASQVVAFTDKADVIALQDLYRALNGPPQLKNWRLEGGDPCEESWTGVVCYGSSVKHLKLQGLNLSGSLGSQLNNLHSLTHLDVSSNYIQGEIPYALPPNATHINLACNALTKSIPNSLPNIKSLKHLNLSHNSLFGPIGNVFTDLCHLKEMDLSYNNFGGDLPSSFGNLTNLTGLFLQNNNFTGSVIYLADLPLTDLNIQFNHFSGVIPIQFQKIPNLWIDGNKFHEGANYPPWNFPLDNLSISKNFTAPTTTESSAIESYPSHKVAINKKKTLGPGGIVLVLGVVTLAVTCAAIFVGIRLRPSRDVSPINSIRATDSFKASERSPQLLPIKSPPFLGPRHIPSIRHAKNEIMSAKRSFTSKYKPPLSAKIYTVAELQSATDSFSEDNLLREGSLGNVYKAELPDGRLMAVKVINMMSLSFQEEEQFLDVIWTASRLRHPNVVPLLGYCVEHGQHLLVYEYISNLSLDDMLHNETCKTLPWSTRLNIALGIACALDYLHSTLSSPIAHGNVKAANILLDQELMPHLSDCGLAVLRPLTSNNIKLKASEIAVGDIGFIEPENGEPGGDNTKTDIYAFGVLLLELLTGRRPFDSLRPRGEQSLVKWASSRLHDCGSLVQMVDPAIKGTLSSRSLSRFADVISLCIQPEKLFRPPMSEIVESLTFVLQKFNAAKNGAIDGSENDPFERSFGSTQTGFMGSPSLSYISV